MSRNLILKTTHVVKAIVYNSSNQRNYSLVVMVIEVLQLLDLLDCLGSKFAECEIMLPLLGFVLGVTHWHLMNFRYKICRNVLLAAQ